MSTVVPWRYTASDLDQLSPFGSVLADRMPMARFEGGAWSQPEMISMDDFQLHPGAHALHYGSSCFEGLKAYRWEDDSIALFRGDRHARRMGESAAQLMLPIPEPAMLEPMFVQAVRESAAWIPPDPGSLYLRPVLLGTDPNIGAAGRPSASAVLYVMTSPVGDYFAGGERALRLLIEDKQPRTTPQFGKVKTGANYASALVPTMAARSKYQADQILFCPGGDVQEAGAANFILIDEQRLVTKPLCKSFLHGVTRDSVLTIAGELGLEVEERDFTVDELLEWTQHGEAALTGTAAVLTGVGTLIHDDQEFQLLDGETGPQAKRLRTALVDIQRGRAADSHGWIRKID